MLTFHEVNGTPVAEVSDSSFKIAEVQDAVDLLGNLYYNNCSYVILKESNLHSDFFRLHTGLAGDVLQKFSNYQCRMSIIGDFSKYKSKSLHDFIRESNRGNRIFFVESREEALKMIK